MPDYNLGRAHGRVTITADTNQATRALGEYEDATNKATKATAAQARIEQEVTRRRAEADAAAKRRKESEIEYKRVMQDTTATVEDQMRAEEERNRARGEHLQAARRATEAEKAYRAAVTGNADAVRKFTQQLDGFTDSQNRATRAVRDFRNEINETERTARILSNTITGTLGVALKGLAITGGIGIAGGALGILGAGGSQGIVAVVGGLATAIGQLSGVVALLPGVVGGAVATLGTLAVAFNGVGDALGAAMENDPKKFAESLRELAPAAAEVVTILASFTQSFKGAMQAVQQELFAPLVDQIQPLVMQWLPALMNAGKQIAGAFGQIGRSLTEWLQQPQTMAAFEAFINNLSTAIRALAPAMEPILNAFTTLSVVGSQFFPQISDTITRIATQFSNFLDRAAADGSLQRFIQGSLTAFGELFRAVGNLSQALINIGSIGMGVNGSFLTWLEDITQKFQDWTESAEGAEAITSFFETLRAAGQVLAPILRIIGGALGQVASDLTTLGVSMGPGLTTFFQGLADALGILGQSLIQSAPAFNQVLTVLGNVLVEIMQQVGPQLPTLFQNLADVASDLAPVLISVAGAVADLFSKLTPGQIEILLGLVVAFQGLSTIAPIVIAAIGGVSAVAAALGVSFGAAIAVIGGVVVAIGLLVAAVIYCATHWDQVKSALNSVWEAMKSFAGWIAEVFSGAIESIGNFFVEMWNGLRNTVSTWWNEAYDWGKNVVTRFIDGIKDMFRPLSDAWDWLVGEGIDEKNPHSPPRSGPLSGSGDPLAAGQRVSERFAQGITAGAPSVSSAYDGAIGGGSYSGTSVNPNFGGGNNGFNQAAQQIQRDLSAWLSLVRNGFNLFGKISDIAVQTMKVVASIWNGGDNPMTQPGGIFAKPSDMPAQQSIPGVPQAPPPPGEAPLPELTPEHHRQQQGEEGAPVVPQQSVPGVPQVGPGSKGTTPPSTGQPAPTSKPPVAGAPATRINQQNLSQIRANPASQATAFGGNKTTYTRQFAEQNFKNRLFDPAEAESGTSKGLPPWLTDMAAQFGLTAVTRPTGDSLHQAGFATDIYGEPENMTRMAKFIQENLASQTIQMIYRDPNTGETYGIAGGQDASADSDAPGYYAKSWEGHGDHIHWATDVAPVIPGSVQGQAPPSTQGQPPPNAEAVPAGGQQPPPTPFTPGQPLPPVKGTVSVKEGRDTTLVQQPDGSWKPVGIPAAGERGINVPLGGPPGAQAERRGGAGGPGGQGVAPPPTAPNAASPVPTLPQNPTQQQVADYIISKALSEGYSREQADWFVIQAYGESTLRPGAYGASTGDATGGASGIFQFTPGTWGDRPGSPMDPQRNIDEYFNLARERKLTPDTFTRGQQLGTQVSIGGPWHPANVGHLERAQEGAAPFIANFGGQVGVPTPTHGTEPHIPGRSPAPGIGGALGLPGIIDTNAPAPGIGGALGLPGIIDTNAPAGGLFTPTEGIGGKSPMGMFEEGMQKVSSVAGSAFEVFDNYIKSIGAAANIFDMLVRGPSSSEDVMAIIDNYQQFITTAASVAKLVGDIGGIVGMAGSGDPTGMTGAVGGGITAIAGIVQSALEATNMAIDLGQEVWHQATKYFAMFAGHMLGGENGFLGGNVRMLLNTATGDVYAYSQENPLQKTTHNLPSWFDRAYGGTRPELQQPRLANVNIFAGPGQNPRDMMNETMWLVNNSGAAASVAGVE
jgi:hypothetical protein